MNKEVITSVLFGGYILLSFLALGSFIVKKLIFKETNTRLAFLLPVSLATGFGVYALLYFLIYCFKQEPSVWMIIGLQTVGLAIGFRVFGDILTWLKNYKTNLAIKKADLPWAGLLGLLVVVFIGLLFLNALSPAKDGDAINGYLETSRWIFHNGFKSYDPYDAMYSTMPSFTEIIYSLSFSIKTEIAAKFMDAMFGMAFLVAIYGFASLYMRRVLAVYAALAFALLPGFFPLFSEGKIDMVCQFVLFSSLIVLFQNKKDYFNPRYVVLSAFLLGISLGQKYTVPVLTPIYFFYLIYILSQRKEGFAGIAKYVVIVGLISGAVFLPHLVRDYKWTGNPLAPFNIPFFHSNTVFRQHKFSEHDSTWTMAIYARQIGMHAILIIGLIVYLWNYKKLSRFNTIMAIVLIELVIWIAIVRHDWFTPRFILTIFALLLCGSYFAFAGWYNKYRAIRVILYLHLLGMFGYLANDMKRWGNYVPFVFGKQSRMTWENKYNVRAAVILGKASDSLSEDRKLFVLNKGMSGVGIKVPYEKLKYTNTENDFLAIGSTKLDTFDFLRTNHFKYVFVNKSKSFTPPPYLRQENIILKDAGAEIYRLPENYTPK
jgi:hypothetical protein